MLIQNIKLAADALVFNRTEQGLQLLLIKRGNEPNKGMWAFPGGFVEDDEELETAALRELEEETGVKLTAMKQAHTFGKVGRDPRGRTVSVTYYAFTDAALHNIAGADDAADAQWVYLSDITEMAFDHLECLQTVLREHNIN